MEQARAYESLRYLEKETSKSNDALVVEAPLQININGTSYTVVMRTPGDDDNLVRGLLYAEDIYRAKPAVSIHKTTTKSDFHAILDIKIPKADLGKGYLNKRTLLSVSSCGICGKKELQDIEVSGKPISSGIQISKDAIAKMSAKMFGEQRLFKASGGSHACAIFDRQENLLTCKEDIGRHNAVDKCIGALLNGNQLDSAKLMLVSGRVSYEIVSKAFFAKIPVIIAVSACSSLAVDFAKEFGICLIGFSRKNRLTIYSNPQYITL